MNEDIGIVREIEATRMRYRRHVSARDWTRALGEPAAMPVAKVHHITVECAKPEERVVKSEKAPVDLPKRVVRMKPAPRPAPVETKAARIFCTIRKRYATNQHAGPMPDYRGRVSDVVNTAAAVFGITVAEILARGNVRRRAYPRFAAMHILCKVVRISLPSIGKVFDRDHTTCMSGIKRAAKLRRTNRDFAYKSRVLARELRRLWSLSGQSK